MGVYLYVFSLRDIKITHVLTHSIQTFDVYQVIMLSDCASRVVFFCASGSITSSHQLNQNLIYGMKWNEEPHTDFNRHLRKSQSLKYLDQLPYLPLLFLLVFTEVPISHTFHEASILV